MADYDTRDATAAVACYFRFVETKREEIISWKKTLSVHDIFSYDVISHVMCKFVHVSCTICDVRLTLRSLGMLRRK